MLARENHHQSEGTFELGERRGDGILRRQAIVQESIDQVGHGLRISFRLEVMAII